MTLPIFFGLSTGPELPENPDRNCSVEVEVKRQWARAWWLRLYFRLKPSNAVRCSNISTTARNFKAEVRHFHFNLQFIERHSRYILGIVGFVSYFSKSFVGLFQTQNWSLKANFDQTKFFLSHNLSMSL